MDSFYKHTLGEDACIKWHMQMQVNKMTTVTLSTDVMHLHNINFGKKK